MFLVFSVMQPTALSSSSLGSLSLLVFIIASLSPINLSDASLAGSYNQLVRWLAAAEPFGMISGAKMPLLLLLLLRNYQDLIFNKFLDMILW